MRFFGWYVYFRIKLEFVIKEEGRIDVRWVIGYFCYNLDWFLFRLVDYTEVGV